MLINYFKKLSELFRPPTFDCIQVEVSAVCNASCPYCVQDCFKDQWKGGLMDMRTFERLRPSFNMTHLIFLQGWGEPLLHPQIWEMVQMVKSSRAKVGFTTNGSRLDAETLSKLLDFGVDILGISLAGVAPAIHERFRKGCNLGRIDAALSKLKEMKKTCRGDGPGLHIAFMLLRSNWHELRELPELAAEWEVSQIVLSNLSLVGSQALQEESLLGHPELWSEVTDALERTKGAAAERGIELHYHIPNLKQPSAVCTENVLRSCFVSFQGDVSPCVMTNLSIRAGTTPTHYFKDQAYPLEKHVFGNIKDGSLRDIWTSKKARNFRAGFEKRLAMKEPGMSHLEAPCQHCYKLLER